MDWSNVVRSLGSIWNRLEVSDHDYKVRLVKEIECFSPDTFSYTRACMSISPSVTDQPQPRILDSQDTSASSAGPPEGGALRDILRPRFRCRHLQHNWLCTCPYLTSPTSTSLSARGESRSPRSPAATRTPSVQGPETPVPGINPHPHIHPTILAALLAALWDCGNLSHYPTTWKLGTLRSDTCFFAAHYR
ncbi:hypothetical protein H8959_020368 [Pygathrix nigripes]